MSPRGIVSLALVVMVGLAVRGGAGAQAPTGEFLCSAGPRDGQACDRDSDCAPGGVCVLAQGVCDGGRDDGLYCDCLAATCVASASCAPTYTGLCPSGPSVDFCCDVSRNCAGDAPCTGAQRVCLGGDYKGFSCVRDAHCPASTCVSSGKFCDGGDYSDFSCIDDADCENADGSGGGICTTTAGQPTPTPTPTTGECTGDCNGGGDVTVNELITMVNIALGNTPLSACPIGDPDDSGDIVVNEIIAAVRYALNGCPEPPPGPSGEFLCSTGPRDGQPCDSDTDCAPGGVCVIAPGLCNGGADDGYYCHCVAGTCVDSQTCAPEYTGLCRGGPNADWCCDLSANCAGGSPCVGAHRVCLGGEEKGFACLSDQQCPDSVCRATGSYCDDGDFSDYSCVDDDDCRNTDGTPGGACVGVAVANGAMRSVADGSLQLCAARP